MFMLSPLGSLWRRGVSGGCGTGGVRVPENVDAISVARLAPVPVTAADFRKRLRTRWILVGWRVGVEGADVCLRIKSVRMAEFSE